MAQLKIAQVATTDMAICVLLLDQIRALRELGHEVTVVCAPGPWIERIKKQGVPVETVEIARELSPMDDLRSLGALYRCFRQHKFDVVHTHTPKAGLLGPLAAKLAGIPVVVHTIHGLLFHDRMPIWKRLVFWIPEKLTATFSDYLLSQSREDMIVAVKTKLCSSEKINYLGNGIDISKFSPSHGHTPRSIILRELGLKEDDFIVGSVGRLVYEKGFSELFASAEELTEKYNNIKFVIIGPQENDRKDSVEFYQIESLRKSRSVLFLDWRDDMSMWYSVMDVFVLPSHREGIPRACMEASAMGKAIITTDIRGCREVVMNGETGLLVPVKDVKSLTMAIEKLFHDELRRKTMGENGRSHIAENFDSKLVLERLCNFYVMIESSISRG